ncbi:hypothetical protein ACWGJ9_10325 [Curtobacterium citreum]
MTNPGLYTPLDCVHHYAKALCGDTAPVEHFAHNSGYLLAAGIAGALTIILAGLFIWAAVARNTAGLVYSGVYGAGAVAALIGFSVIAASPHTEHTPKGHYKPFVSKHLDRYDSDLRLWLSTDYRITVDEQQTSRLRDGETVAVRISKDLTPVTLIDAGDHHAAVQRVGGGIISPTH